MAETLDAAMDRCGALLLRSTDARVWEKTGSGGQPELVSEADCAVEKILIRAIRQLDTTVEIVAEETQNDSRPLDQPWCFVVDPIDGTKEFVAGRDGFSISAALLKNRRPVLAVLDFPARRQRFLARRGQGVLLNGRPLRIAGGRQSDGPLRVAVSPKQFEDVRFEPLQRMRGVTLLPVGALASKVAGVAAGEYDGAFFLGWEGFRAPVWDFAGAGLVLEEAGGLFTSLDGLNLLESLPSVHSGGWLAANSLYHRALLELILCASRAQKSRP
jgi:myo-inositol-1(or 4)-monophosphatase